MPGELDLGKLLRTMEPVLHGEEFVFCSLAEDELAGVGARAVGMFREPEGITLILRRADAERAGIAFTFLCRMITLRVHSSLEAVGFLAAVAAALAKYRIAVNAVSGYHHDHLFVPVGHEERAMQALRELEGEASQRS